MKKLSLFAGVLLASLAPFVSHAVPSVAETWFFADFDHPTRLGGRALAEYPTRGSLGEGRYGRGYVFTTPSKKRTVEIWSIRDPELVRNFPTAHGSFACWFRAAGASDEANPSPAFVFGDAGRAQWQWTGETFRTAPKGGTVSVKGFSRSTTWRHFAATWDDERLVCYLDGEVAGSLDRPVRTPYAAMKKVQFNLGNGGRGYPPASNQALDEIAVFSRSLSAEEVRSLAAAPTGLAQDDRSILLTGIRLPYFWRDDPDAALRTQVFAPDGIYTCRASVGGKELTPGTARVKDGVGQVTLPFAVSRYRAGDYDWKLTVASDDGRTSTDGGRLRICPRLDRDKFKFFNWGGNKRPTSPYLRAIGVNCTQVRHVAAMRQAFEDGFSANLRFDNDKTECVRDFDPPSIEADVSSRLRPYAGVYGWVSTLANTEMYYNMRWLRTATNSPAWLAHARQALGNRADWRFTLTPDRIDFKAKGMAGPYVGIFDDDTYRTLSWFRRKGNPLYLDGAIIRKTVHAVSSGNRVWSEPIMGDGFADFFDLAADWVYDYLPEVCLYNLRSQYGNVRPCAGRGYMPTLSMCYCHYKVPPLTAAAKKAKVSICQSADELMIKSWMALGAIPVESLSLFSADSWEHGVVEPNAVARYGAFMRERFAPVCDLLRNLPNEDAPFAVAMPDSISLAGSEGWGPKKLFETCRETVGRSPYPFEAVRNREILNGRLNRYRSVFLPSLTALTAEHAAAIDAAIASGVRVAVDRTCRLDRPAIERLENVGSALGSWLAKQTAEMRARLFAWSDEDGSDAYTFVKEYRGVRYVVVVNNARRRGGAPQNGYCDADWYNPFGAPRRLTTHFKTSPKDAVYDFTASARIDVPNGTLVRDFAPAEGRVYAVYPQPLGKITLEKRGNSLVVRVLAADGMEAPGRQVVRVTVTDPSGAEHDETGRYVVEGETKIPLRFADDDLPRGTDAPWRVRAKELTSGLTVEITF